MLERFRRKRQNREVVDRLWDGLVLRARRPYRFVDGGLPDTVMGRFESLAIEVFLLLRRCGSDERLAALSQDVVDRFMTDLDHSMRELGVGYLAVPKRMRKLAGRFYVRVAAFEAPVSAGDAPGLADALRQTAFIDAPGGNPDAAEALATHMLGEAQGYSRLSAEDILAGHIKDADRDEVP